MAAGTNSATSKRSNRIVPPFAWLGTVPSNVVGRRLAQSIDQFAEPARRRRRNASTDVFIRLRFGVDGASERELQFAARAAHVRARTVEVLAELRARQADAECPAFKVRFPRGRFFGKTGKTDL